ncbi:ribosomal processing [Rhodotorula diobovata]|uniref:Ribosomal processing n=1 Tax=Rhodotorula diobovata TaxID=5288 RepID=A0A5C5FTU1_9BASI|nr:ribosomal processing [Rhodotorula diobovata]
MPAPKRYFDQDGGSRDEAPHKRSRGDGFQQRGRGRGGGSGGGGRGRGGARGGRGGFSDDRPKKEAFKPKEGWISAGLKAHADAAAESGKAKDGKAADADPLAHQTTLYLTNLPPTLTSPQLQLIFSSYAPVRAAFVVSTAQNSGAKTDEPSFAGSSANTISLKAGRDRTGKVASRGFGYVRFVLRADAEQCLAEWGTKEGVPRSAVRELELQEGLEGVEWDKVCGTNGIHMSWAKKKLREGEKPEGGEKKPKKEKKPVVAPVEGDEEAHGEAGEQKWRPGVWDHNAVRTVIVQGLPLPGEEGSTEGNEGDDETKEGDEGDESKMDVDAGADDAADADAAPAAKKGKLIDWKKALRQRAKKVGDVEDVKFPVRLASGEQVALVIMYTPRQAHDLMSKMNNHVFRGVIISAAIKSSWDLCQRQGRAKGGGRLLIRNLGFDVKVADLRTAFARFGPLHSITLPVDPATSKGRGFAFVYFVSRGHAEKALAAVNGTRVYAGMAAERIATEGGKEGKKKEVREKKKAEKTASGGGGGDKGRVVAVDWALSQEEWKKVQEGEKDGEEASGSDADEESGSGSEDDSEEDDEDEDSDMSPVPEDLEEDSDMSPEPVGAAERRKAEHKDDGLSDEGEEDKPQQKGTTLFVRNMSFEATEPELYDLFKAFGPVRYARIVYDPTTKRSRGTAFVCFWNDESAQAVLNESRALNEGSFGETSTKKTSLLMADPSSSTASRLTLHGRVLAAVPAVSKNDADKLREERDKKGAAKMDRRNLYLMREGVIFPSWAIAKTLSAADMDARQSSFDARKSLLRSNPSLYISRTRLSIRQIPLYVTDGMLKRLANHAIREFDRDVKAGVQKPLTSDELVTFVPDASGAKEPTWNKVERKKGIPLGKVRQSKILRQNDRVDPVTGLGRSKGYGFLELGTHADALKFLRWANANKEVNRLFRTWWREELDKMLEQVEKGEGKLGKGVKATEKDDRLKRLREKRKELEEEERVAQDKEAKREAAGRAATGEGGRSSKCLIIEFSIENAVTTKRRAEKAERAREKARRVKENGEPESDDEGASDEDEDASPRKAGKKGGKKGGAKGGKKRRADDDGGESAAGSPSKKRAKKAGKEDEADKPVKEGARIGGLIGRKRKEKKGGKR